MQQVTCRILRKGEEHEQLQKRRHVLPCECVAAMLKRVSVARGMDRIKVQPWAPNKGVRRGQRRCYRWLSACCPRSTQSHVRNTQTMIRGICSSAAAFFPPPFTPSLISSRLLCSPHRAADPSVPLAVPSSLSQGSRPLCHTLWIVFVNSKSSAD